MRTGAKKWRVVKEPWKRKLLIRNLVTEVILRESIETHYRRAQLAAIHVERLISLAKKRTLTARRQIANKVNGQKAAKKLFWHLWKRFEDRQGGFTRVLRTRQRKDTCRLGVVELVDTPNTILTSRQLLAREERRLRRREHRAGLGALGLAVAIPSQPGTPPERIFLQSMLQRAKVQAEEAAYRPDNSGNHETKDARSAKLDAAMESRL